MSWTTGTQTEALSSNWFNGSAAASFTAAQCIGSVAGAAYLPANFFQTTYGIGKSIFAKFFGVMSCTATPTFSMGVSANSTQGTYNGSAVVAVTPLTSVLPASGTNMPWELEVIIACSNAGASGTLLADGKFRLDSTATAPYHYRVSSSTANPNTALTISTESAYYLEVFGTFSASNAGNSMTVYNGFVLGLN